MERKRERQADTDSHTERMLAPNDHTTTIAQLVGTGVCGGMMTYISRPGDKTDGSQEEPPAAGFVENLASECG